MTRALAIATLLLTGCSAIVAGGEDDPIRCVAPQAGEPDPCLALGPEWRCQSDYCQHTGCVAESCNGMDDDCDGTVDEELDDDGDGFTWCRSGPTSFDCDDTDATTHPAGDGIPAPADACDGKDNDCDPSTVDGATCPSSTICDVTACMGPDCAPGDRCVMIHCGNRPEICTSDQFCDHTTSPPSCQPLVMSCLDPAFRCDSGERCNPENGDCVTAQSNGMSCNYDAECASNLCVSAEALRINGEDIEGAAGICSRTCCDDSDCSSSEVCWDSGSGARACVPRELLDRGPHGAPTVSACLDSSSCSSGVCELHGDDAYRLDSRYSLACGSPYAELVGCSWDGDCWAAFLDTNTFCGGGVCHNAYCTDASDCPTGICIGHRCADSCRTASTCPSGDTTDDASAACLYGYVATEGRMDFFPFCQYLDRSSTLESGAACSSSGECRDQLCVDALGRTDPPAGTPKACAATCCSDTQCGDIDGQCRPIFVGTGWEMHCLPRRTFDQGGATSG